MTAETHDALQSLRDGLRSARRPGELLSPANRAALLATIARVGLVVARDLGHSRRDLDIGAGTFFPPCPVERLAFLQSVAGQILAAAERIGCEPPAAVRHVERPVPLARARHISANALRMLARTPNAARVNETVAVPSTDTPANRVAKTILAAFARDVGAIAALAQAVPLPKAFADAETLRRRFAHVLRRAPWRDLPLAPRVLPLAPQERRREAHVLLHDLYRRYRAGFAWDFGHPLFHLPERDTWQLYEYFTFFAAVETLRGIGFRAAQADAVRVAESGVSLSLATGKASHITLRRGDQTVRATFQRRFTDTPDTHGFRAAAHDLMPDIVLEHAGQLLVLDAKFKTYADPAGGYLSPLDDSRQLHSYRDAIRSGNTRSVSAAWVLYCGRVTGANRAVIAFPASTLERPFGGGEIGAVLLRPGAGNDTLAALIEAFLRGGMSAPSTNDRAR